MCMGLVRGCEGVRARSGDHARASQNLSAFADLRGWGRVVGQRVRTVRTVAVVTLVAADLGAHIDFDEGRSFPRGHFSLLAFQFGRVNSPVRERSAVPGLNDLAQFGG